MLRLTSRGVTTRWLLYWWSSAFSMITPTGSGHCDGIVTGGLDAPETGDTLGPNLLVNGDLRSGLQGWTFNPSCFSLDGSGDTASLRLQQPCAQPFPSAKNAFKCPPGLYTISAEIKTQTNSSPCQSSCGGTRIRLLGAPAKKWAMTKAGCRHDRLVSSDEGTRRGRRWQRRLLPRGNRGTGRWEHHGSGNFSLRPRDSPAAGNLSAVPELSGNDVQRPEPGRAGRDRCQSACGHHHGAASRRARSDGSGREGAFDQSSVAAGEWLYGRDHRHGQSCAWTISATGIPGRARRQAHLHAVVLHDRQGQQRDARLDEGVDRFGQYHSHGRAPAICDRPVRYDRLCASAPITTLRD